MQGIAASAGRGIDVGDAYVPSSTQAVIAALKVLRLRCAVLCTDPALRSSPRFPYLMKVRSASHNNLAQRAC